MCRCGCGTEVTRTFAQGHDQVYLARLRSAVDTGQMTSDQALQEASTISAAFSRKVSRSLAIVADHKAREARREQPTASAA